MQRKLMLLLVIALGSTLAHAQPTEDDSANENWREFCDLTAANVRIFDGKSPKGDPFTKHKTAIFEHKNPFNRDERGLVYLWKQDNGRPVAIFTCLVIRNGRTNRWNEIIEYHSLHDQPINTRLGEIERPLSGYPMAHVWRPKTGIIWSEVEDAPVPDNLAVKQRLQTRAILRRFQCIGQFGDQEYQLQAQAKPVYTWEFGEKGALQTGMLTFYCRATDPEAILMLEVRKNDAGKLRWHYALGNFTRGGITFKLDKRDVFENNTLGRIWFDRTQIHYGGFPARGFLIEEGIQRQLGYAEKKN